MFHDSLIMIPARMGSTRLPGKILLDIAGKTMIERVIDQALQIENVDIVVAICEKEVENFLTEKYKNNERVKSVMTDPDHPSGTDRIYEALLKIDNNGDHRYSYIINLQGDLPVINPEVIISSLELAKHNTQADIVTPVVIKNTAEHNFSPDAVKAVVAKNGQALYFSRSQIPYGAKHYHHHVGIYVYKREALDNFVNLSASHLEKVEKLEQLRALEADMKIFVNIIDEIPMSVDNKIDLQNVNNYFKKIIQS